MTSANDASTSAPTQHLDNDQPRRWLRSTLRVSWTGDLPASFDKQFQTTLAIDSLVRRAFDQWSSKSIPEAGLQFNLQQSPRMPINASKELLKLPEHEIIVVFTNAYEAVTLRTPELHEDASTFERVTQKAGVLGLTPTVIVIRNATINTVVQFEAVLLHEIGHALGLDHSPVQWTGREEPIDPRQLALMPAMTLLPRRRNLHPDDRAWVSALYQTDGFLRNYGWIEGRVVNAANPNDSVDGVQVYAIKHIDDRLPENLNGYGDIFASVTPHGGPNAGGRFYIPVPANPDPAGVPYSYTVRVRWIPLPFDLFKIAARPEKITGEYPVPVTVIAGKPAPLGAINVSIPRPSATP